MDGGSSSSDNDAFDDITSIEDGDSSSIPSRQQTSIHKTKLTTDLRPRKSVSQLKQEMKVGHAEKVVESNISNPEVKNTVKDIITLLRGLDSIGGGFSDGGDDEDEIYTGKLAHQDGVENTQSSGNSGSRAIRVSNVIVKYEDPHSTKFTFETFDPDYTRKKVEDRQKDVDNVGSVIRNRNFNNNTKNYDNFYYPVNTFTLTEENTKIHHKSTLSFDSNSNERQAEVIAIEKKSVHFSKDKLLSSTSSRFPVDQNSLKTNSKLFPVSDKKSTKSKVGIAFNKSLTSTDIQPNIRAYSNKELAQTAKLYRNNLNNNVGDEQDEEISSNIRKSTSSSSIISQDNEETFYSYSHSNRVYKEPTLSFFLPSLVENDIESRREINLRTSVRSTGVVKREASHIGAPFFRLDGSVVEDVNLTHPTQKIDIRKYVRAAVQEQQSIYEQVTENARELKKRVTKTDASHSPSIIGTNNNRSKYKR